MFRPTARERAISCKTLICFLQSLVGHDVTIEQKDDVTVTGRLLHVDAQMNCQMTDGVRVRTPKFYLSEEFEEKRVPEYFVNGTKIRYVLFDEEIEPISRMEDQLGQHRREQEHRKHAGKSDRGKGRSRYQDPRTRAE